MSCGAEVIFVWLRNTHPVLRSIHQVLNCGHMLQTQQEKLLIVSVGTAWYCDILNCHFVLQLLSSWQLSFSLLEHFLVTTPGCGRAVGRTLSVAKAEVRMALLSLFLSNSFKFHFYLGWSVCIYLVLPNHLANQIQEPLRQLGNAFGELSHFFPLAEEHATKNAPITSQELRKKVLECLTLNEQSAKMCGQIGLQKE